MPIIKRCSLLFLPLLVWACGPDPGTPPAPAPSPTLGGRPEITILAFGDSLTEGFGVPESENYPTKLQAKLVDAGYDAEVINGGISGETTTGALDRLDWMLNTDPDIVIVETGANDALRGVDPAVILDNLDEIVRRFSDHGTVVIVAGMQIIQNLGDEYTTAFASVYPEVAEKHGAILIPFVLEGVAADPELNLPDFIHPNAAGYTVMADHIYPFVLEGIARLGAE